MKALYLVLISVSILSCRETYDKNVNKDTTHETKHSEEIKKHNLEWTYEGENGPEHWVEIEKQSTCNGFAQSPINIIDVDVENDASSQPVSIHYSQNVKIHELTNDGHSIQYVFEKGDYIVLADKKYDLKQIHFHEPAEHTINGIRYPLEMHMVHLDANNNIAVLAVLAMEGKSSEPFTFLEQYLPVYKGETKIIDANFDLNQNLPTNKAYYTYSGSLTTPPCTENVTWIVYKNPITVSVDQVRQLQDLMPLNNYRGEQPVNGRIVKQVTFDKVSS
ncbi:MAG: carbonic anhydrase family protein [Putridiphycobacter sp.]|nr:carbonic anhydrase family protein [Putridiphycobacter sp.]